MLVESSLVSRSDFRNSEMDGAGNAIDLDHFLSGNVRAFGSKLAR